MSSIVSIVPRHPETFRDASGRLVGKGPIDVDRRDQFWRRVIRWGDVIVQDGTDASAAVSAAPAAKVSAASPATPDATSSAQASASGATVTATGSGSKS